MGHSLAGARITIDDPEAGLRRVQEWATERGAAVLLADAAVVFGADHLESAALHAERARDAGTMATRSVAMEALLYLAGARQVADAIRIAGIKKGTEAVAVAVFGRGSAGELLRDLGWPRDDAVLSAAGKSLGRLGIPSRAAGTVPEDRRADLALERTALVDVLK